MAAEMLIRCPSCGFSFKSWDDGKPYMLGKKGGRHYFYNPLDPIDIYCRVWKVARDLVNQEHLAQMKWGNESEHLCRKCLKRCFFDPTIDPCTCKKCGSPDVVEAFALKGQPCPKCHAGPLLLEWTGTIS